MSEHKEHPAYKEGYSEGYGHGHKDGKKGKGREERKAGGRLEGVDDLKVDKPGKTYNAKGSHVEAEAEKRAAGGGIHRRHKEAPKAEHHAEGGEAKPRMDRMARKSGGRTGSNASPLSSAANVTSAQGRKDVNGSIDDN